MRALRLAPVLLCCLAAKCGTGSMTPASSSGSTTNTGDDAGVLAGTVSIGPNCPVERAGVPCPPSAAAYTSRHLAVYAMSKQLVQTVNIDTTGHYRVSLRAGRYVVDMAEKSGVGGARLLPDTVQIAAGKTTTLDISIDTGIR